MAERIGGAAPVVTLSGGVTYAWPGELLDSIQSMKLRSVCSFHLALSNTCGTKKAVRTWKPSCLILDRNVGYLDVHGCSILIILYYSMIFYDILGSS